MKKHIKEYYENLNLGEQDFVFCELHYITIGASIRATDIHHIIYRSHGGEDEFGNLIALCRRCHTHAHDEKISKDKLKEVHLEFINDTPYD